MSKMMISISKKPDKKAALNAKELHIRERFYRMLFGPQRKVVILIPNDQIGEIAIIRKEENQ